MSLCSGMFVLKRWHQKKKPVVPILELCYAYMCLAFVYNIGEHCTLSKGYRKCCVSTYHELEIPITSSSHVVGI